MAFPGPETHNAAHRKQNSVKLWDLICCKSPSTTSPIEATPRSNELEPGPRIAERDYSDVIDTADSIVSFALNAVVSIGSGLPGIGAVSVVLAAKDKFMTDRVNRKEMDKILKYIEELCEDARTTEGAEMPVINLDNARFMECLRRDFAKQEKSKGWQRALDIINADSRKEDLVAVWQGIERAMKRRGLAANVNSARLIENVFQKLLEVSQAVREGNVKVNDIHAVQVIQMTKDEEKAMDDLLSRLDLSTAKGARFDSGRTEQTRLVSCTADTRVEVMEKIKGWASGAIGSEHVFWLNGLAGTGKSTIATTIAKWAREERILGGSFFFSRDLEHLNSTARVFLTLAHQLALFDEQYKRELCITLRTAGDVASANLEIQLDALIRNPLAACQGKRSILVMLDALDECSPEDDVKQLLRLLLQYNEVESGGTKLRFFITSRPESHIRLVFSSQDSTSRHKKVVLHDIDKDIVRNDIEKYLRAEFKAISSGDFEHKPPQMDWPSSDDFERVLNKCGEFFAYAATVVRFIGDTNIGDPVSQLADILEMMDNPSLTTSMNPYLALDNLYLAVLEQAARKDRREGSIARMTHVIATIVCLREPMSVPELALFLGMTLDDVRYTLRHLYSVIRIPVTDRVRWWNRFVIGVHTVQFFHQSFPDFLKDQNRCPSETSFLVDAAHERSMASRCIDLNSLHRVKRYRPVLWYAAINWASHFRAGTHPDTVVPPEKGNLWPVTTGDELTEEITRLECESQANLKSLKPWSERTRKGVLDAIWDWITWRDEERMHLFWLYGLGGRGCPDIGMYINKWARDERIPGAYMTFDYALCLGMHSVFPVLASQLARFNSEYRSALYNIIQRDQGILISNDFRLQFETLIRQPMTHSICHEDSKTITQPILLVLDGYEGMFHHEIAERLHFLSTLLHLTPSLMGPKLYVLDVSKPESTYRALLDPQSSGSPIASYEFDEHMDRDDIKTFFERWLQEHEEILPIGQLEKLLDFCGASVTFARAAIRFIFDREVGDPDGRLREILNVDERLHASVDDTGPYSKLDRLYRLILQQVASNNARKEDIDSIRCIIATIICLRRTNMDLLSSELLVFFLSMEEDNIRTIRQQLRCVECDAEYVLCGSLHPSFEEFIQDKARCTDSRFLVDVRAHERFMVLQCCRMLQAGEGEDTFSYTYHYYSAYHYSSAYWPSHLRSAMFHDPSGDLMQELDLIRLSSDKTMLASSYRGQTGTGTILLGEDVDIIPFIRELVEKYQPKESETILALLRDAEADEKVAWFREDYLRRRKELLGEEAIQMHSGGHGSS